MSARITRFALKGQRIVSDVASGNPLPLPNAARYLKHQKLQANAARLDIYPKHTIHKTTPMGTPIRNKAKVNFLSLISPIPSSSASRSYLSAAVQAGIGTDSPAYFGNHNDYKKACY